MIAIDIAEVVKSLL